MRSSSSSSTCKLIVRTMEDYIGARRPESRFSTGPSPTPGATGNRSQLQGRAYLLIVSNYTTAGTQDYTDARIWL